MAVDRRATTQDISWFLDLYKNGQLELDPPYQRRSVWSPKDRRFFLDTIFRGYPSPSIFLYKEVIDGKTIYDVVDGKQRLQTIINFSENKIALARDYGDARLDGKKWAAIRRDSTMARAFWDYVLPVEFISVIEGTTFVNEVFDRLNRNSRKLVEQELRHAKFDGWFITFVEMESNDNDWEKLGVVTTARAKRMADVQFLSELLMVVINREVVGFDQENINDIYARYEDPLEIDPVFSQQEAKELFDYTKSYLLELERINNTVTKYAKDFNNLYTLWAVVCLNKDTLPSHAEFVQKYTEFMEDVNKYRAEGYLERVTAQTETPRFENSMSYFMNSTGASTDLTQRLERYNVLRSIIITGN